MSVILPSLPTLGLERNQNESPVFQTWRSITLHSNTVCSCLRSGLVLYGIVDQAACPTQYRKAASTLISMHNPSMQEPLSQFMCHERSTAGRHYRHHMSHRYLSSVFTELGRCQAKSDEVSALENVCEPNSVAIDGDIVSSTLPPINDCQNSGSYYLLDEVAPTIDFVSEEIKIMTDSLNVNLSQESRSPRSSNSTNNIVTPKDLPFKSKYSPIRNGKSIFPNQYEEDLFFFDRKITCSKGGKTT